MVKCIEMFVELAQHQVDIVERPSRLVVEVVVGTVLPLWRPIGTRTLLLILYFGSNLFKSVGRLGLGHNDSCGVDVVASVLQSHIVSLGGQRH